MSTKTKSKTVQKKSLSALDLVDLEERDLKQLMCDGMAITPLDIAGYEFKGISLNLPLWMEKLTWKKFKKAFYQDPNTGEVRGWNIKCVQNGLTDPWVAKTKNNVPQTFGHFAALPAEGIYIPTMPSKGVLLDYGQGKHDLLDPLQLLRDPLIAVNEGDKNLLLGFSYLQIGPLVPPLPTYFSLERDCPLSHIPEV